MEGAASESPGLQLLHVSISLGFSAALGEHRREGFLLSVRCPEPQGSQLPAWNALHLCTSPPGSLPSPARSLPHPRSKTQGAPFIALRLLSGTVSSAWV